jgi:hypothetical protein
MSLEFVLPMSLEFSVTYVPERFTACLYLDEFRSLRATDGTRFGWTAKFDVSTNWTEVEICLG